MEMTFTLPGGARVDGEADGFVIKTDQPPNAAAPSPFTLFLASIGACAGVYVQAFCQKRGIPTKDIRIVQQNHRSDDGHVAEVEVTIDLPTDFPAQYRDAVARAADRCTVKQHLAQPPRVRVATSTTTGPLAAV